MKSFSKSKLVLGAMGFVLLAGAGGAAAVAATQGSTGSYRQAYIDDLAKRLNVSPSALTAAMQAARNDQIEAALAAGRITKSQAEALKQQGGGAPFFGPRFGPHGFGGSDHFGGPPGPGAPRGRGGPGGFGLVVAHYLGVSPATLDGELESGKSLSEIASSTPGKSVEGVKATLIAAAKAQLATAVSAGWITSQQEQERLADTSSHIGRLLQRHGVGGPNRAPSGSPNGGPGFGLFGP